VGAGEGHLVDLLTEKGFTNIWVLDISQAAIERTKQRMGKKATGVHWIVADMLTFEPPVQFDVWHDRAAFHFLTTDEKINRYISIAEKSVKPGGHLFMGTFSELGPKKCSGLEIKQYSGGAMTKVFSPSFQNIRCVQEDHLTPFQTMQNFLFCSFIKLKHSPVI
jgi:SAM-dependent methyltransferase